jgi:hypothetical protein
LAGCGTTRIVYVPSRGRRVGALSPAGTAAPSGPSSELLKNGFPLTQSTKTTWPAEPVNVQSSRSPRVLTWPMTVWPSVSTAV